MHFPMWGVWIYDNSDNRDNKDNCEMCMDNGINIDRRVKSERIRLIRILEIMASDEKLNTDFTDLNWYKRQQRQSMGRALPNVFSPCVSYENAGVRGREVVCVVQVVVKIWCERWRFPYGSRHHSVAKCKEKRNYEPQTYTNPTSYTLSYTQSYTRNCQ